MIKVYYREFSGRRRVKIYGHFGSALQFAWNRFRLQSAVWAAADVAEILVGGSPVRKNSPR